MAGSSSSSSSSSSVTIDGFTFDVFISFRGLDTRHDFTGNLYKALKDRGICTFFDKEDIPPGKEITPSLHQSIEQSRMAIVVLSPNYATSSFCLKELSHIIHCIRGKGRLVWPIFYGVKPSDVRWLEGTYGEAMAEHEVSSLYNTDTLQKWKDALHEVADLKGTYFKNEGGYQYEFIENIVEQVSRQIKPFTLPVADKLVGLDLRKQDVISLLNVGSNDEVHMVGIHGIGGIGKTTLALEVYNLIADQFEGSCFLENVRENSEQYGLTYLQNILLSEIVGEKETKLTSVRQGIAIIQQRLRQKKVLLLVDDVNKMEQLHAIAGEPEWFGDGSRIIITTRDKGLLKCYRVKSKYEMMELHKKDALELLRWKVFRTDKVSPHALNLLKRAVTYASGLPLALEVLGSHLSRMEIEEWQDALDEYERIPHIEIQQILKVSFDALGAEERSVFLDIACGFKGHKLENVERMLHAHHDKSMKHYISVLVQKSLIKISESGNVSLHDLIEDMGKEIVRQESREEPGRRSRLWSPEDIVHVLEDNTGTSEIEIICPNSSIKVNWDGAAFKKMEKLRTLIISSGSFSSSPKHLPNSLRILNWRHYPSSGLPLDFYPKKLAICKLPNSEFISIMPGDLFKKKFKNMRVLNFNSGVLTNIPDVSGLPNLEELSFQNCSNLITVDASVGLLDKLKILSVCSCSKLKSIPPLKLASLEQLNISRCHSLESFSPVVGSLDKLKILHAKGCRKLRSFPPFKTASLEELDLSNCVSLDCFPSVDGLLGKLKILSVYGCSKLSSIPPLNLASLEQLSISCCDSLESFPEILGEVENITQPCLDETPVKELTFSFQKLTRLQILYLKKWGIVHLPSSIVVMPELTKLTIEGGGCLFPKQEEGEEKVSPMQFSQVEFLSLRKCNLLDGSLAIGLKWFANVKELYLSGSRFTILPECIEKCQFLWKLFLDNCEELQEIKGIPPSLKTCCSLNCQSLTSSSKSKLLKQELHEAGNTWFRLPRANIPEWFDHQSMEGLSISFWFRNKFPAIALCVVSPLTWSCIKYQQVSVIINGNRVSYRAHVENNRSRPETYHLHLFHLQMERFDDNLDRVLLENKWNHVEVHLFPFQFSGIHVLKEKSEMKDIRFTNPEL